MESENRREKKLKLEDKFGEEKELQKPNLKEEIEPNNNDEHDDSEWPLLSLTKLEDTHHDNVDVTMETTAGIDISGTSNNGKIRCTYQESRFHGH